jgi:Protein of unknown function (DUF2380)
MGKWVDVVYILGATCLACFSSATVPAYHQATAPTLAIVELDFIDTSGEVREQQGDHMRRLKAFTESLRGDLVSNGRFRIVALDCPPAGCPTSSTAPDELVAAAGKAGATYVLLGGIHKMSTLVQWAKVEIVDVDMQKVVFDRLLTFRGDDDVSWQRAEEFLARDILGARLN